MLRKIYERKEKSELTITFNYLFSSTSTRTIGPSHRHELRAETNINKESPPDVV